MITQQDIDKHADVYGEDHPFIIWIRNEYPKYWQDELLAMHLVYLQGSYDSIVKFGRDLKQEKVMTNGDIK